MDTLTPSLAQELSLEPSASKADVLPLCHSPSLIHQA